MDTYRLWALVHGEWELVCTVLAETSEAAMRDATNLLKPRHRQARLLLRRANEPPGPEDESAAQPPPRQP